MKPILQSIFAFIIGIFSYFYYGLVLPDAAALVVAVIVTSLVIFTILSGKFEMRAFGLGGLVITVWPAGAVVAPIVASWIGISINDAQSVAAAVFLASPAAMASYFAAEKRDRARDIATISLSAICLYTISYAIISRDTIALAIASFGVAVGALVLKQQLILPPRQEFALKLSAAAAAMMGVTYMFGAAAVKIIW